MIKALDYSAQLTVAGGPAAQYRFPLLYRFAINRPEWRNKTEILYLTGSDEGLLGRVRKLKGNSPPPPPPPLVQ